MSFVIGQSNYFGFGFTTLNNDPKIMVGVHTQISGSAH